MAGWQIDRSLGGAPSAHCSGPTAPAGPRSPCSSPPRPAGARRPARHPPSRRSRGGRCRQRRAERARRPRSSSSPCSPRCWPCSSPGVATTAAWTTTNELRLDMTRHVLGLDHEFHRHAHPGRTDPTRRRRRHVGVGVPRARGDEGARCGAGDRRHGRRARRARLAPRPRARALPRRARSPSWSAAGTGRCVNRPTRWARSVGSTAASRSVSSPPRTSARTAPRRTSPGDSSRTARSRSPARCAASAPSSPCGGSCSSPLAAGWVVVLVLGAWTVSNDMASIGTIFLLYQYVLLIGRPLEDLVHELETVQKANGAMVRVLDLLAIEPKVLDEGDLVAAARSAHRALRTRRLRLRRRPAGAARRHAANSVRAARSASSGAPGAARRPSRASCCGWSSRRAAPSLLGGVPIDGHAR